MTEEYWRKLAGASGGGGGGGSKSGLSAPSNQNILQLLSWTPGSSNILNPGVWVDGRIIPSVVDLPADLSDKTKLPLTSLVSGKLVYVRSEGMLYEYTAEPTTATGTIADWKPLVSGVKYVGRENNLPTDAVDGQIFVVRMDFGGKEIYRLLSWEEAAGLPPITVQTGTKGADLTAVGDAQAYVAGSGSLSPGDHATLPQGSSYAITGTGTALDGMNVASGDSLMWTGETAYGLDGWLILRGPGPVTPQTVQPRPNAGSWRYLNRETFLKEHIIDQDQPTDRQPGDLQITTENNAHEIKTFANGAWQTIFSEQDVKAWIAAGSQFQGTVQESGHNVAGALDLGNLPAQNALSAGEKAHYWIWVGTSGYTLPSGSIGGAPSAIDTSSLTVGDWIIVAETGTNTGVFQYRIIPGDLMSRTVARQMFSLKPWVGGAWPEDSVVVYNGDVYRAAQDVLSTSNPPDTQPTPWQLVNISGGLKVAQIDSGLPQTAPPGQVWVVLGSARAGNKQALYAFDQGVGDWQRLGGDGGTPMDLTPNTELISVGVPVGSVTAYAGQYCP